MRTVRVLAVIILSGTVCVCSSGCGDKFWDPTQIGRFRPVPAVNVILDSLGVAEEMPSAWANAEEPKPSDVAAYDTDYVFAPGDVVRISIFELLQEGLAFTNDYVVTETGKISIPEVGVVEAAGLTENQLEEQIRQILSPTFLKYPSVTVTLVNSQQRTFSIWGNAVEAPGRYPIPRYDFRLTDALAVARVDTQFNVSYVYVSRQVTGEEPLSPPAKEVQPEPLAVPADELLEIIAPRAQRPQADAQLVIASSEMATVDELSEAAAPEGFEPLIRRMQEQINGGTAAQKQLDYRWEYRDGKWVQVPIATQAAESPEAVKPEPVISERETIAEPVKPIEPGRVEWIFREGKWVPLRIGPPEVPAEEAVPPEGPVRLPELEQKVPSGYGWDEIGTAGVQTRVIKIPTDKLAGGDPRYNVLIRPGDSIHVPFDIIGEFYVMGNVNNQGVVPLTGRPMTLKMAIAAAGGLGPLAWPKKCEIVRRIGRNKEETVMVDLDKIASGEQPDFFIKPNDIVNVGTHPTSRWRAVLRNAFRATYGFGFIYDRNFADRDFGTHRPFPGWF